MKTVTVQLAQLVSNFSSSQCDYLLGSEDDHLAQPIPDTELFLQDLRNLLNPKRGLTVSTLRRLFSEGFTMMMLPPDQFEFLETAAAEEDDFCIVVKNGKSTLCILCEKEVTW